MKADVGTELKDAKDQIKKVEAFVDIPINKFSRTIWNAALDKAAITCDSVNECLAAARIRELKK